MSTTSGRLYSVHEVTTAYYVLLLAATVLEVSSALWPCVIINHKKETGQGHPSST